MTPSDDRSLDPAAVASASFTTTRRGFDPNEVRAYLQRLSAALASAREQEAAARDELEARGTPDRAELDEATVAAWLGEEAARVLTTAREAASQVRAKAEEYAEQLRHEVHAEVAQLRADAQRDVALQREEVDAEVTRRRQESIAEAEAEIEGARQEGRSMVSEARAVRERMLADLSRRRDGARAQLAALRGERDRIVNAIEATRDHLDRLMDDLRAASPDDDRDLPSVSYDDPRSPSEPRLTLVRPLHPVHQEREPHETGTPVAPVDVAALVEGPDAGPEPTGADDTDLPLDLGADDEAIGEPDLQDTDPVFGDVDDGLASVVMLSDAETEADVDVVDTDPEREAGSGPGPDAEVAPEDAAEPATARGPEDAADATTGELPVTPVEPSTDSPGADPASPIIDLDEPMPPTDQGPKELRAEVEGLLTEPAPSSPADDEPKPSVDDLFARIRAARAEGVEPSSSGAAGPEAADDQVGAEPAGPHESAEPEPPLDHDAALVHARDTELAPLHATLARQLKRALADEQNEVFDRLRRLTKVKTIDEVLGSEADHAERYRAAGEDAVWAAALAGARSTAGTVSQADGGLEGALERHKVLDVVLDEVSLEVAMPVRERLEAALGVAEGDPDEATALLRNAYREWKAQRLDGVAGDLVLSAFGRGAYSAIAPGTPVAWIVDHHAPACPDGDVNAAASPLACGEAFPTGHRHPPASAGCRCLLEPTHG